MLPLSPQLLWHDCFLGREERRGLKIQNREKECTQKSTRVSRSFSAPKTKLKKPHLPRQVIWLGYVPSHTLTPSPTCELSEAKTTFIPSKKKKKKQPSTHTNYVPSSFLLIWQLTTPFLRCFFTLLLGLVSWFCPASLAAPTQVFCRFLLLALG